MTLLEIKNEGYENIGFQEQDARNHERNIRQERKDFNAQMLLEHFQ